LLFTARFAAAQATDSALKSEKGDKPVAKQGEKPVTKPAPVSKARGDTVLHHAVIKHTPHIIYVFDPILAAEIAGGVLIIAIPVVVWYMRRPKKRPQRALPADAVQLGRTIITVENEQNVGARRQQEDAFGFSNVRDRALIDAAGVIGIVADG